MPTIAVRPVPSAPPVRQESSNKSQWPWLSLASGLATVLYLFRIFFSSQFTWIYADQGDGRLALATMEHWYQVFMGRAQVASPAFFFPDKGILGYTDAYFLQAIPYAIARSLGLDRYLAFEVPMLLMACIAFASMLCLLRRVLKFSEPASLLGAVLFTLSSYTQSTRTQLYAVAFVPVLIILGAEYWRFRRARPRLALCCICGLSILFALLLFTSYYIGWFAGVSFAAAAIALAGITACTEGWQALRGACLSAWDERRNLLLGAAVFAVAIIPFLAVYLPAHARLGNRPYANSVYTMVGPLGVFDTGDQNIIWGSLSRRIEASWSFAYHEARLGWPVAIVLLFVATSVYCAWRARHGYRFRLMLSVSIACFALWLASVKLSDTGPLWIILYSIVPGGGAIRVPARIDIVLNIGVIVVAMFGFDALLRGIAERRVRVRALSAAFAAAACVVLALTGEQHAAALVLLALAVNAVLRALPGPRARRAFVGGGLALFLIAEQIGSRDIAHAINRTDEIRRFSRISPPPSGCEAFYVSNVRSGDYQTITTQIDAMLLSQQIGVPTINGYSGWYPKGWTLADQGVNIKGAVDSWLQAHSSPARVCSLDFDSGRWGD